jgi:hypothetical protein
VSGWACTNHLLGNHDDSLDGETTTAVVEEILERGTQQVNHKDVVKALLAEVVDIGNAGYSRSPSACEGNGHDTAVLTAANKDLVCPVLVTQLRSIALARFLGRGSVVVLGRCV